MIPPIFPNEHFTIRRNDDGVFCFAESIWLKVYIAPELEAKVFNRVGFQPFLKPARFARMLVVQTKKMNFFLKNGVCYVTRQNLNVFDEIKEMVGRFELGQLPVEFFQDVDVPIYSRGPGYEMLIVERISLTMSDGRLEIAPVH